MADFFHTIGGKIVATISGILLLFSGGAHTTTDTPPNPPQPNTTITQTAPAPQSGGAATTTVINRYITQPAPAGTPAPIVVQSSGNTGVDEATLNSKLSILKNDLLSRISQSSGGGGGYTPVYVNSPSGDFVTRDLFTKQTDAIYNSMALMNRIDQLSGTKLSNITITGVSGLTDADIPDGITASNYLALTGGTLSGDLVLTGNLTVSGAQTLSGAITIPYLNATSTDTDSTFFRLTVTNATTTNATSTNLYASTLTAPTANITNLTFTNATGTSATTTNLFSTNASSTNLHTSNLFVGSLTGFLKATAGAVAAALVNLASDVTGILPTANGGTGWANIAASAIPYGNGSGALATTTAGTAGQVLAFLNGVPTWTATTTFSSGLSYSGSNVTLNTGNANTWTALQQFSNASTSLFSAYGPAYFGGSATSSFSNAGVLTLASALTVGNGGTGQTAFGQGWLNSDGTTLSASTSPTVNYITATSTTATSTLAGGFTVETSGLVYDYQTNRVGIGTASPSARLSVADSSDPNNLFLVKSFAGGDWGFGSYYATDARVLLSNNASAAFGSTYTANAGDGGLRLGQTGTYSYIVGGTNLLLNPVAGKVGIATTTPWKTLSVVGTMAINGLTAGAGAGSLCLTANKEVVYSDNAGCTGSSLRFKHSIETLDGASGIEEAMKLRPVSFMYNDDIGVKGQQVGFIAEDVAQVDERLITRDASGTPNNVKYQNMVAIAIKAVQELYQKVSDLANTVAGFAEKLVTKELVAKNIDAYSINTKTIQSDKSDTKELCVDGTCITGDQFRAILQQNGQQAAAASATQSQPSGKTESTSTPETETASTTSSTAESPDATASSTESATESPPIVETAETPTPDADPQPEQ